jgi:hypothetical protein
MAIKSRFWDSLQPALDAGANSPAWLIDGDTPLRHRGDDPARWLGRSQ